MDARSFASHNITIALLIAFCLGSLLFIFATPIPVSYTHLFQALPKVILPEILPGMISGFILAFTLSIDDFAVTIFTIGNEGLETLSTYIYADARKGGLTPELRPLSTIIFVTVLVLSLIHI